MDTNHGLRAMERALQDTRMRLHELEAHRKTLAVEIARIDNDVGKAKTLADDLTVGIDVLKQFAPIEAA